MCGGKLLNLSLVRRYWGNLSTVWSGTWLGFKFMTDEWIVVGPSTPPGSRGHKSSRWPLRLCHFHFWWRFNSILSHLPYSRSTEMSFSSVGGVPFWFTYGLADCRIHNLFDTAVPGRNQWASRAIDADTLYAAQVVVWAGRSADCCSLKAAVFSICLPSQLDNIVADAPSVSTRVTDANNTDLDTKGDESCLIYCSMAKGMFA